MSTVASIITDVRYDLKMASTDTARNDEFISYINRALRGIIAPILNCARSDLGRSEWVTTETVANVRRYSLPTDLLSIYEIYCIKVEHSGTLAAGGTSSVTLASTASEDNDAYNGMLLRTTGGTGADQQSVIYDYTGSTKAAYLSPELSVAADSTTTYSIFYHPSRSDRLSRRDLDYVNLEKAGQTSSKPCVYALDGSYLVLGPIPDDVYVLWGYYWSLPALVTATSDELPYHGLFDNLVRQYVSMHALIRDEYNVQMEQQLYSLIETGVWDILAQRGERTTNLSIRGTEED